MVLCVRPTLSTTRAHDARVNVGSSIMSLSRCTYSRAASSHAVTSPNVTSSPTSCFHTSGGSNRSNGQRVRTATPMSTPRNSNMARTADDVAASDTLTGSRRSRFWPALSRALGHGRNIGSTLTPPVHMTSSESRESASLTAAAHGTRRAHANVTSSAPDTAHRIATRSTRCHTIAT
jgi:hypothetical protein